MLGAIIGDVAGSTREFNEFKGIPKPDYDCELIPDNSFFTDDTVLTVAVMDWILSPRDKTEGSLIACFQKWAHKYPNCGFGGRFVSAWLNAKDPKPYGSFGNGSGMRVSPVAYIADSRIDCQYTADLTTKITHNHYEGIAGGRVIALATYMAFHGASKKEIKQMAMSYYPEIENMDIEMLRVRYCFNELSRDTCPQAVYCFLISKNFEDCLRLSLSIGGDSDTLCAMSCSIAEAFYKEIPEYIINAVWDKLTTEIKEIVIEFNKHVKHRWFLDHWIKDDLKVEDK